MYSFPGPFWCQLVLEKVALVWLFTQACCIYDWLTNLYDFSKYFLNMRFSLIFSGGKQTIFFFFVLPVRFYVHGVMHLPLYPLLPSSCLSAKNSELTFHMHSWLSLRNMERLQQLFCLTGLGHWWDGWLPSSRRHQQLILGIFIHLQDPPLCSHTCVCLCDHAFIYASEICMFSVQSVHLCRWKPAGQVPSKSDSTAWLLLSLVAGELLYYWLACLHWKQGATQTCHYLSSTDIQAF